MWHLDHVHRFINLADAPTLILLDDCARIVTGSQREHCHRDRGCECEAAIPPAVR
jgi:hypothetical protein